MNFKVRLSIGYPTACREGVIKIDDSELENLTEEERENVIGHYTQEWANNYIELYWEEE